MPSNWFIRPRRSDSSFGDLTPVSPAAALAAVDDGDLLHFARATDDDPPAFYFVKVKRVQRLAQLEHHIVGDVDDIIDRAQADGFEPPPHPVGAWSDANISDDAGDV